MKKVLLILSILLYIIAFLGLVLCGYFALNSRTELSTAGKLCLIGIICLTSYFGSLLFSKTTKPDTSQKIMKYTFELYFIMYIVFLVTLVLFDTSFGRTGFSLFTSWNSDTLKYYLEGALNLIPFATVWEYVSGVVDSTVSLKMAMVNILGNLMAFAPFAFFLPLIFNKFRKFKNFLIAMFCIVVAVELLQFVLLTGSCDIDDVILNVGGTCLAYRILNVKGIKKVTAKITTISY